MTSSLLSHLGSKAEHSRIVKPIEIAAAASKARAGDEPRPAGLGVASGVSEMFEYIDWKNRRFLRYRSLRRIGNPIIRHHPAGG
ncbi:MULTISPECIES: hypothetical protein [unclassified Bradyrhizobium]|uniref:hypothetical protein n=1 Tax=unclassified Bradyrhizobium TaxID=2631580 RepID=UPI001FF97A5A|nr:MULTISPECIES: hypothetical protein [unclassified Bradyrhizobium]MCK1271797.1 hypothetical protein [Bradyrhizobium sp. 84]MCK1369839.1 hypothetical protein [Bradyrhizobium sp. 49]MCK1614351.1 hypothetical protein [Bradyrhizobium sp. 163]MCK1765639.1 hypothetical protein [Bradyrhizobium sp. 136]